MNWKPLYYCLVRYSMFIGLGFKAILSVDGFGGLVCGDFNVVFASWLFTNSLAVFRW